MILLKLGNAVQLSKWGLITYQMALGGGKVDQTTDAHVMD